MNFIANIELLIYSALLFTPPLLIAALGTTFQATSGIINIGLDGFMTVGAFASCVITYYTKNTFLGLLSAGLFSAFFSIIFAILVLKYKTNEILVGFTLNIFLPALVIIISYAMFKTTDTPPLPSNLKIPTLFRFLKKSNNGIILFLSNIFSTHLTTYLSFLLVILSSFIINKTKFGLYIRALGSNQNAATYVGIDKTKLQFICILISGFLCGISGAIVTMAITNQFRITSIVGQGYIALAAVLFGNAKPFKIMICCLVFGLFSGLKVIIPSTSGMTHLVATLPYIATILILILQQRNIKNKI